MVTIRHFMSMNLLQIREILESLRHIYNLFINGVESCDMVNWCAKSGISIDERCRDNPWSRCGDNELCPYAMLWKYLELSNNIPVKQRQRI